jgi:hypothetical protein
VMSGCGRTCDVTVMITWTGLDANALRKALRMSVTDFAEHLGAAHRSEVEQPRPRHSAADADASGLDTVLARASAETRERFELLRLAGIDGAPMPLPDVADTGEGDHCEPDQDGDMQRREFLTDAATGGVAVIPAVARLLDALLPMGGPAD